MKTDYYFLIGGLILLKNINLNTDWLYPSFRGEAPISDSGFSNLMWETFAEYGFAKNSLS